MSFLQVNILAIASTDRGVTETLLRKYSILHKNPVEQEVGVETNVYSNVRFLVIFL
jgi:hypothetical protein